MELKSDMIVKKDGILGKIVTGNSKGEYRFLPINHGRYYIENLDVVTEDNITLATLEQIKKFIMESFSWGSIIQTHIVGEYLIIEYNSQVEIRYTPLFKPYILNPAEYTFTDTKQSFESLDMALIGTIAYKYEGQITMAKTYFSKMIGMDRG